MADLTTYKCVECGYELQTGLSAHLSLCPIDNGKMERVNQADVIELEDTISEEEGAEET